MRSSSRLRRLAALVPALGRLAAAACGGTHQARRSGGEGIDGGGSVLAGAAASPAAQPPHAGSAAARAPAPAPPATVYRAMQTLRYGGVARGFLYVAPKPGVARPLPLLVVLHGRHADAAFEENRTQFDRVAAAGQAVVVYPEATGMDQSWNAGRCCDAASKDNVDDVGFIDAVISTVRQMAAIDPRRIYVAGYSTGAMMAYRYTCERPTTVAAVAEVGGVPVLSGCPSPGPAVSLLAIHGSRDHAVPYYGTDSSIVLHIWLPSVPSVVDGWRIHDGCTGRPAVSTSGRVQTTTWTTCRDSSRVELVTLSGWDHYWPTSGSIGFDATGAAWAFLRGRHR